MTPHIYVDHLKDHVGEKVQLKGWLYNMRSSGKLCFLQVRDGTGVVQCVVSKADVGEEIFAVAAKLSQETSLMVTGSVRAVARSPIGVELGVESLQVVHAPTAEYP